MSCYKIIGATIKGPHACRRYVMGRIINVTISFMCLLFVLVFRLVFVPFCTTWPGGPGICLPLAIRIITSNLPRLVWSRLPIVTIAVPIFITDIHPSLISRIPRCIS
ncbi:hypothetical protein V1506DRAFT_184399 [Lipomyces tetrasporus]